MQHLWLHQQGGGSYRKSQAPYVFTRNEAKAFVDFVAEMQVPTRYVVTIKKHVGNQRLQHMKERPLGDGTTNNASGHLEFTTT
jgi:hypothetical protein